ncbi:MAG: CxxxxCH/CxxCH domain c-type cytochrome, partial [Planctomycetota bacterium]
MCWTNVADIQKANLGTSGITASYAGGGGTCVVYCHGADMPLGSPQTVVPDWNTNLIVGTSPPAALANFCDRCHEAPPTSVTAHSGSEVLSDCAGCHPHFNTDGTLNTPADHIDGAIQAFANCDSCHGYPPTPGDAFGYQAVEGKGAHVTHVDHIEALYIADGGSALDAANDTFGTGAPGAICGTCHTSDSGNHQTGDRIINFGDTPT